MAAPKNSCHAFVPKSRRFDDKKKKTPVGKYFQKCLNDLKYDLGKRSRKMDRVAFACRPVY